MKALSSILHKFKSTVHILGNPKLDALVNDLELTAEGTMKKESLRDDIERLKAAIEILTDKLFSEMAKRTLVSSQSILGEAIYEESTVHLHLLFSPIHLLK